MGILTILRRRLTSSLILLAFCAFVLMAGAPRKAAAQDLAEYALLAGFIQLVLVFEPVDFGVSWNVLTDQLNATAEGARTASAEGNRPKEIGKISKVSGLSEALIAISSPCEARCDELRSNLQDIIGLSGLIKARALGVARNCNINGIIDPTEECDPLAQPNGCQFRSALCDNDCECVPTGD